VKILHHDNDIIVISKPGELLSVPGRGRDKQDCVVSRIRTIFPEIIEQPAVHRLDMQTSGLMVLARTVSAHRSLSIQFAQREVKKHYIALLDGIITGDSGRIELKFRLDVNNRPNQIYDPDHGKKGITLWNKIGVEKNLTRVAFTPVTGRTHQLRIHSAHPLGLATPIVGDRLYGFGKDGDQMMLHATRLSFNHPRTGDAIAFEDAPPF
jgi:tRNA pseudouridine32 synthase/23S rRNA pseudouridine746 synthase